MEEVGGSNPTGPTEFLRHYFYKILFFQNRGFWRVSSPGHYQGNVSSDYRTTVAGQLAVSALLRVQRHWLSAHKKQRNFI